MTGTAELLEELLADCDARSIQLRPAGDGGLTIDAPKAALTPVLMGRLKAHKGALLKRLQSPAGARSVLPMNAEALWHSALEELEGDPLFPPSLLSELREATIQWVDDKPPRESSTIEPP